MPALAGFSGMRPDLPGSARSALRPGRPGLMALRQALHDLIRACGVTAAHLVGHSMGTLLCQYLAAAQPKLVTGLTLYAPLLVPPEAPRLGLKARAETVQHHGRAGPADTVWARRPTPAPKPQAN